MNREVMFGLGLEQLAEWAANWVDNETCLGEAPSSTLSDKEKAGLVLLYMFEKQQ